MDTPPIRTQFYRLDDWRIDTIENTFSNKDATIKVEKRLVKLLVALAKGGGAAVSKEELINTVWHKKVVTDDTLSVGISQLRKVLGCKARQPRYIETINGYGFKLLTTLTAENDARPAATPDSLQTSPLNAANKLTDASQPVFDVSASNEKTLYVKVSNLTVANLVATALVVTILTAFTAQTLFTVASVSQPPSQPVVPESLLQLQQNPVFSKAGYLISTQTLDNLKQAESLLTTLNHQQPGNAYILDKLAEAKFQQRWFRPIDDDIAGIKRLYRQSLELWPENAAAFLNLGIVLFFYEKAFDEAETQLQHALALEPRLVDALKIYSSVLLAKGDFQGALLQTRILQSLDPAEYSSSHVAWIFTMAEDFQAAESELAKLLSLKPDSREYHQSAAKLYEYQGDEQRAFTHYLAIFRQLDYTNDQLAAVAAAFNRDGLKGMHDWLANFKAEQANIGHYYPPLSTARYHLGAGQYERALDLLEEAYLQNNPFLVWLNTDPMYAPLKGRPRFVALIKKLGLDTFTANQPTATTTQTTPI